MLNTDLDQSRPTGYTNSTNTQHSKSFYSQPQLIRSSYIQSNLPVSLSLVKCSQITSYQRVA